MFSSVDQSSCLGSVAWVTLPTVFTRDRQGLACELESPHSSLLGAAEWFLCFLAGVWGQIPPSAFQVTGGRLPVAPDGHLAADSHAHGSACSEAELDFLSCQLNRAGMGCHDEIRPCATAHVHALVAGCHLTPTMCPLQKNRTECLRASCDMGKPQIGFQGALSLHPWLKL